MHPALSKYLDGEIDLSLAHQNLVHSCFKLKYTKRHKILVPKGGVAKHIYFVVKGCLQVFLTQEDGNKSTHFLLFR